jgi:hypothetical protein
MIKGKVELFSSRVVSGWFAELADVSAKPKLEIVLNNAVIASGVADQPRPDVRDRGHGDGLCEFKIRLPQGLSADELSRLRLRVGGSNLYLALPPRSDLTKAEDPGPSTGPCAASPVFIVGSPRSGTSALTRGMLAAGYHGYAEGNLLGLSQFIDAPVSSYFKSYEPIAPRTLLGQLDCELLRQRLFDVFKNVLDDFNPVSPWFDKTGNPETINMLPRIMTAWPSSRVIFTRRRGVENVLSRMSKFPERNFSYHCDDWAANMRAWRIVREQLDRDRITEVDQRELTETPDVVSARLQELLTLTPAAAEAMSEAFRSQRPQETFEGSSRRAVGLRETGWDEARIKLFREKCGAEMQAYAYAEQ